MTKNLERGLVQIYCGHGKGKTTAAFGQALRLVGHRRKCLIVQFLKGSTYSGELWAAERLAPFLEVIQVGRGCPYAGPIKAGLRECTGCGTCFEEREEDRDLALLGWEEAKAALGSGEYQLVVLDELSYALSRGYIEERGFLAVLAQRKAGVEVVLTGRDFPQEVLAAADLVTKMEPLKHPYDRGQKARWGIEY
jgi:cob(I)alamin adenosyltransferase